MNIFAALPIHTGFIDFAMVNFGEGIYDEAVQTEIFVIFFFLFLVSACGF